jgi:hypothetical protein
MLIICSGPDTWHARKKAKELVQAFRGKHDEQGLSTEILPSVELKVLLNLLASPSLFTSKRFIRCDGLLESLKIAEIRILAKRLKDDADQTILLSVEEEPPTTKILSEFSEIKCIQYTHPLLVGSAFLSWCLKRAEELGVPSNKATEISRLVLGDIWLAEQELMKISANPLSLLINSDSETYTIFDLAEQFLTKKNGWRESFALGKDEQLSSIVVSQARAALRVVDHEITGLHPFAVKKISQLKIPSIKEAFLHTQKSLIATRQGLANSLESQILL